MRIFVDSAKIWEVRKAVEIGCSGCTTNPSLLKAAVDELRSKGKKIDMEDYIRDICKILGKNNPVSLEVISHTEKKMVEEAKILYEKFNPVEDNVVIKIPVSTAGSENESNFEGLKAIKKLEKLGMRTNATLIMTPEQALLAQYATYVSPFAGRIDDHIRKKLGMKFEKEDYFPAEGVIKNGEKITDNGICSGVDLVRKIINIFKNYDIKTRVIAASIRNSRQVREVAEIGAHIATLPFKVIEDMTKHYKTVEGFNKFSKDVIDEYKALFD